MLTLPSPSSSSASVKLDLNIALSLPSFVNIRTPTATALITSTKHQLGSLRQPVINTVNAAVVQELCPVNSVKNFATRSQTLRKEQRVRDSDGDGDKSSLSNKHGSLQDDGDGSEREIKILVQRLKTVVERIRRLEIEKFMGVVKGEEEILLGEKMSEEIVAEFLEKPIKYLRVKSCRENLDEKVKNVKLLVNMLEASCSRN